jgi:hypothetical protein
VDHFREEYEKRKAEINEYLILLDLLGKDQVKVTHLDNEEGVIVSSSAIQVSKASFYLILYNLAEATINAGIQSIYNRISDENLSFADVGESLQKVWWSSHSKSLTACSSNTLIDNVYDLYQRCLETGTSPDFRGFISGVSGSIDAEGVRDVCKKYGITVVSDGRDLQIVKNNRNWLSHGNKSFSDVGKDVVIGDLKDVRTRTFSFMDEYVENVTLYLTSETYKNVG